MEAEQARQLQGHENSNRRKRWLIRYVITFLLLLVGTIIILPSFSTCVRTPLGTCAANLRRIGQALYIYAQDYPNEDFPTDIALLISQGHVKPEHFVCPLNGSASSSYLYVQGGTLHSDPESIIIFENPLNHSHVNPKHQGGIEGGKVLFQDSHVTFIDRSKLQKAIDSATATGKVVRMPSMSGH